MGYVPFPHWDTCPSDEEKKKKKKKTNLCRPRKEEG
jgi:hypothetical protein